MVGVAERRGPEREINPVDTSVRGKDRKRTSAGEVQKGRGVGVGRKILKIAVPEVKGRVSAKHLW